MNDDFIFKFLINVHFRETYNKNMIFKHLNDINNLKDLNKVDY